MLSVYGINGPVVTVAGKTALTMHEMVHVGSNRLVGEVISINEKKTTIQVYENTSGLYPGEPVTPTGSPMSIMLAPGLLGGIYDGIARPLKTLEEQSGHQLMPGADAPTVDTGAKRQYRILVRQGDVLRGGEYIAELNETGSVVNRISLPQNAAGKVVKVVPDGEYSVLDTLVVTENDEGKQTEVNSVVMWPIRTPRPARARRAMTEPLITGQRIIDTLFPIARGGAAAIPGGFGTGKTMLQHQLAKWSQADIIVYVGCGERGNEMTQVLEEFSSLTDPRTGRSMLERTVLIANTSNMPVAAREASIYTGVTIAEYYRDMGYDVAMMADSTSRWAEALREISGRLEEMPAEEGFPAYLPSRLASFYERSGRTETLAGTDGSVTIIGAVSPQGSDFSEPVTQNTKRFIRCYWALDKSLAYARHYPAVNWNMSYSEYVSELSGWYQKNIAPDFMSLRDGMRTVLHEEDHLMEIVKLIGSDLLAEEQKLVLETARTIRVGFLQQNAMNETDTSVPVEKQYAMMKYIMKLHERVRGLVARQIPVSTVREKGCFERLVAAKYNIPNDDISAFDKLWQEIENDIAEIEARYRV